MTEKETHILNLVMDEKVLRRIAWHQWTSKETIPDELFIYLAGSWVVHSELGLDHDISMNGERLRQGLEEGGIPYQEGTEGFRLVMERVRVLVKADGSGETLFLSRAGSARVSLSGASIARLICFVEAVLPQAERMVAERVLRIERDELASTFAARVLREKLDSLGILHHINEYCDHLKVEVLLPPDGKLSFSFEADQIDKVAAHIQEAVSAARTLHELHLGDLFFRPLQRWDRWAEPFNRSV